MNITIVQHTDFNLPITLRNPSSNGVQGNPINLTGASAVGFVFKGYAASERVPFSFEFDPDRTSGKVAAILSALQAGALPYGLYLFEIKLFDALGKVIRILKGTAMVDPGAPNA
jgi:hypothetical protein